MDAAQFPYLKHHRNWFHTLLPYKYIIHTHSVYINIICCKKGGKYIVRDIFPEAIWVRYANPGKEITSTIARAIAEEPAKIIFMQNHGVIVSGDNANETYALHSEVNKKVIKHFNMNPYFKTERAYRFC